MDICKLCLEKKELKRSHIIPEFVFKPLYDEKHCFHALGVRSLKKLQKGIREKLLCGECEGRLSKYEHYMSQVGGNPKIKKSRNGRFVTIEGLDYKKVRLFGLSILWRASVSSLKLFRELRLGPHEDIIRKMILTDNPGNPSKYPFMLMEIVNEGEVMADLIMPPLTGRYKGYRYYRFVFGGCMWIFVVSSHEFPSKITKAAISKEGKMVMDTREVVEIQFIVDFMKEAIKNPKHQPYLNKYLELE